MSYLLFSISMHFKKGVDGMYIDPFWAGVVATIVFEVIMFFLYSVYVAIKSSKDEKSKK